MCHILCNIVCQLTHSNTWKNSTVRSDSSHISCHFSVIKRERRHTKLPWISWFTVNSYFLVTSTCVWVLSCLKNSVWICFFFFFSLCNTTIQCLIIKTFFSFNKMAKWYKCKSYDPLLIFGMQYTVSIKKIYSKCGRFTITFCC